MTRTCEVEGCPRKHHARGLCYWHYNRLRSSDTWARCSVPGCGRPHAANGLCNSHRRRLIRYGSTLPQCPIAVRA